MISTKVSREKGKWLRVSAPGSLGWIDRSLDRYEILARSAQGCKEIYGTHTMFIPRLRDFSID